MKLPGEFKPRSSKQCAGFSCGFVYTVRDRSHLSPSHHQQDPDLCVDDTMSSDHFSDDQLAQETSNFECSFASGFDMDANSAMGKLCVGRRDSVEKTCSAVSSSSPERRGKSCWTRGNKPHQESLTQSAHIAGTPGPSRQPVGLNECVRQKSVGMRCHHELLPLSCIDRSQKAKAKTKGKKKDITTISQRAAQIVDGAYTKESEDVAGTRCDRELHVLRWSLEG